MIGRREFIAALGGAAAAAAWPLRGRAQAPNMPLMGNLSPSTFGDTSREVFAALGRGLAEMGFVEGRNLAVERRFADFQYDRLPALADDLVRRQVAVIYAATTPAALAAKAATKSIPIVFMIDTDPVEIGLVASLNRPGGNLTGVFNVTTSVAAKRLEFLHALVPAATTIAFLVNPSNPVVAEVETRELQAAARILGVRLVILNARDPSEFDSAFAMVAREQIGGLVSGSDPLFFSNSDRVVALENRYRVPMAFVSREATAAGGLMSYGTDLPDGWRLNGTQIGRILKGEKPGDLPVQQVTKMHLTINMKAAKALGLTFPITLLGRADEVIE